MGAEELRIQSDFGDPLRHKSRILPPGYRCEAMTTGEQEIARLFACGFKLVIDGVTRRLGQLEPRGLAGLSPTRGGAVESDAISGDILDSKGESIAATQLTVDRRLNMAKSRVRCST